MHHQRRPTQRPPTRSIQRQGVAYQITQRRRENQATDLAFHAAWRVKQPLSLAQASGWLDQDLEHHTAEGRPVHDDHHNDLPKESFQEDSCPDQGQSPRPAFMLRPAGFLPDQEIQAILS